MESSEDVRQQIFGCENGRPYRLQRNLVLRVRGERRLDDALRFRTAAVPLTNFLSK